jgi:plastocyanin
MRKPIVLFAILAASQAPLAGLIAQTARPESVTVELSSFKFSPAALRLQHGRAYRLHLVNTSGSGHDFAAPEFFAASAIAPEDRALVAGGKVKLAARHSADVTLTPEKAGTYALRCTHFLHSTMGMSGTITVE